MSENYHLNEILKAHRLDSYGSKSDTTDGRRNPYNEVKQLKIFNSDHLRFSKRKMNDKLQSKKN